MIGNDVLIHSLIVLLLIHVIHPLNFSQMLIANLPGFG